MMVSAYHVLSENEGLRDEAAKRAERGLWEWGFEQDEWGSLREGGGFSRKIWNIIIKTYLVDPGPTR